MQAGSFGMVAAVLVVLALSIALAVTIAAPILAVPFFAVGFAAFLLWRAKRRSESTRGDRFERHVPTTEDAAADPVGDSSVPDAARSASDAQTRHGAV